MKRPCFPSEMAVHYHHLSSTPISSPMNHRTMAFKNAFGMGIFLHLTRPLWTWVKMVPWTSTAPKKPRRWSRGEEISHPFHQKMWICQLLSTGFEWIRWRDADWNMVVLVFSVWASIFSISAISCWCSHLRSYQGLDTQMWPFSSWLGPFFLDLVETSECIILVDWSTHHWFSWLHSGKCPSLGNIESCDGLESLNIDVFKIF